MKPYNIIAALAVVGLYAIAAQLDGPSEIDVATATESAKQDAEAQASRDFAAQQVCGNGSFEWVADQELRCVKRKPLMFAKVKQ